jgi:hypothetical protein
MRQIVAFDFELQKNLSGDRGQVTEKTIRIFPVNIGGVQNRIAGKKKSPAL